MQSTETQIFQYFDYRKFLEAYYRNRKFENPRFSYRSFAQKAGFTSSGLYLALVQGRQNLTTALLPKFIRGLGLSEKEAQYFSHLMEFTHATNGKAKQHHFEKMLPLMPLSIKRPIADQKEYYSHWYYVAVRESLSILNFRDEYIMLGNFLTPTIKLMEAKKAIKVLSELGLIKKSSQGFWRSVDVALLSGSEMGPWVIRTFQAEMMERAKQSLELHPKEKREISTSTFSISEMGLERIQTTLKSIQKKVMAIVQSDIKEDRVYQLNIQLFPLSEVKGEG